jgi:hypothetical protein
MQNPSQPTIFRTGRKPLWVTNREAALNWLALGVLLAAWNTTDSTPAPGLRGRPEALRGYRYVSVRAANREVHD